MEYKLLTEGCRPYKKHNSDAGWDLKAADGIRIAAGKIKMIPLGIRVAIPEGWCGLLIPRSSYGEQGLALANTTGVIDSEYRGEVCALVRNLSNRTLRINKLDRIIQLVIVPFYTQEVKQVTEMSLETERGEGGFGSTGK